MRRAATAIAAALAAVTASAPALAGPNDAAAGKLTSDAMGNDYLSTAFGHAEKKLRRALAICASGCEKTTVAKIHRDLATILFLGMNRAEEAKVELGKALDLDPGVKLDPDYSSREMGELFASLKAKSGGAAPAPAPQGRRKINIEVAAVAPVGTPVPIYVTLGKDATAARLRLRYRAAGAPWKSAEFKPAAAGFLTFVPCSGVSRAGEVLYYILGLDAEGDIALSEGAVEAPLSFALSDTFDDEPPHAPGQPPPQKCGAGGEVIACEGPACGTPAAAAAAAAAPRASKRLEDWFNVSFEQDLAFVGVDTHACSEQGQVQESYACFRHDGVQYRGTPQKGHSGNIASGVGLATSRVLLGYDRIITGGLGVGARIGYVVRGLGPRADGVAASAPMPEHLELRLSYTFANKGFAEPGIRPVIFVAGGLAQVDYSADVSVKEDRSAPPTPSQLDNPSDQSLTAYLRLGRVFAGGGAGLVVVPTPHLGLFVNVKTMILFPSFGASLSPEAGVALGL